MGRAASAATRAGSGALAERLAERREEIESAVLVRVHAIADPTEVADPAYAEGLRAAVAAAIGHAIAAIEAGDPELAPVPTELLAQARAAARARIPLETVVRRYVAGHALLADFAMREADGSTPTLRAGVQRALRTLAVVVDRQIAAASEQYRLESESPPRSPERRRAEWVSRRLAGEPADASELEYPLEGWHLALVAADPAVERSLRELARALDRRLLLVRPDEGLAWAWLGGAVPTDPDRARELAASVTRLGSAVAIGEPAQGPEGWRLTHRQAVAALSIAELGPEPAVRYRDVALLATALRDEVLVASLRRLYLEPLEAERDGGVALRETLRAYFSTGRNVSSASAALGVSRPTVKSRLATVEKRLGRPPDACAAELETALRLRALRPQAPHRIAK